MRDDFAGTKKMNFCRREIPVNATAWRIRATPIKLFFFCSTRGLRLASTTLPEISEAEWMSAYRACIHICIRMREIIFAVYTALIFRRDESSRRVLWDSRKLHILMRLFTWLGDAIRVCEFSTILLEMRLGFWMGRGGVGIAILLVKVLGALIGGLRNIYRHTE